MTQSPQAPKTAELLRCPFCAGNTPEFGFIDDREHLDHGGHFIQCTNIRCGASIGLRYACGDDPHPLLAEQWNARAPDQSHEQLAAAYDRLRDAARKFAHHHTPALHHILLAALGTTPAEHQSALAKELAEAKAYNATLEALLEKDEEQREGLLSDLVENSVQINKLKADKAALVEAAKVAVNCAQSQHYGWVLSLKDALAKTGAA